MIKVFRGDLIEISLVLYLIVNFSKVLWDVTKIVIIVREKSNKINRADQIIWWEMFEFILRSLTFDRSLYLETDFSGKAGNLRKNLHLILSMCRRTNGGFRKISFVMFVSFGKVWVRACVRACVCVFMCVCVLSVDSHVRQSHLNESPSLCGFVFSLHYVPQDTFPFSRYMIVNTESMSTVSHLLVILEILAIYNFLGYIARIFKKA